MTNNVNCSPNDLADIGDIADFPSTVSHFLLWLENEKGLRLCNAYKPQYEWYVPANFNTKTLVTEFCKSQPSGRAGVSNIVKPAQLVA